MIGAHRAAPRWLAGPAGQGRERAAELRAPSLRADVPVLLWSPTGARDDEPLPLLVVHDGPAYAAEASLTRYLSAGVADGWLPPVRAALLGPGARDRWYSANTRYARALRLTVLPAVTGRLATTTAVGMGTSLGALAMLHAHRRYPDAFGALFLQSGSFFAARFDGHERWFPYYERIVGFVAAVERDAAPPGAAAPGRAAAAGAPSVTARRTAPRPVPVVLTCGATEENIHNNRLMANALAAQGYDVSLHEVAGGHDFTAWRDALDPHLTRLLWLIRP